MSVSADVHGHTARHQVHGSGHELHAGVPAARVRRRPIERDEDVRRPGGRPVRYEGTRMPVSAAPHAGGRDEIGWGAVLLGSCGVALVMAAFIGLAQWRGGGVEASDAVIGQSGHSHVVPVSTAE